MSGLVVDLFAGGGGASLGIELAIGRSPDVAINHDPVALAVHRANHPQTRHLEADVWEAAPRDVCDGRPVDLLWASPDCTHHSRAKGDVPRSSGLRSLAWVVVRWAKDVRPRLICLENVAEFTSWGPLGKRGRPLQAKRGRTFRAWIAELRRLGYAVEWRVLDASRYGAPTRRLRLFLVARCDGQPIEWPEPTHADPSTIQPGLFGAAVQPWRTAAECIDWTIPCPSIFDRKRPLASKTLWRIAEGIRRYVLEAPSPFIVKVNHGGGFRGQDVDEPLSTVTATQRGHGVVLPYLVSTGHGEREGQAARAEPVDRPAPTVTRTGIERGVAAATLVEMNHSNAPRDPDAPLGVVTTQGNRHNVVTAFLTKHFGGVVGHELDRPAGTVTSRDHHALTAAHLVKLRGQCTGADLRDPMPTVTASGTHVAEVRAFLTAYYGQGVGQPLDVPARTITAKHRLGLVTVEGTDYQIADIGMRMLEPHELLRAQFGEHADAYDLSAARTKSAKVRLIGNSVAPDVAAAVLRANCGPVAAEAVA